MGQLFSQDLRWSVSPAALSLFGAGILGRIPSIPHKIFLLHYEDIVVSLSFIILMSKTPRLGCFHTALGVLPVLCYRKPPEHYPAFPAASPQHSCDKNTPGFGQATPGDATARPGSCDNSKEVSPCHLSAAGMPWALQCHHQRALSLLVPYHIFFILLSKFCIAATTCVCVSSSCGLLLLEVARSLVTL